MGNLTNLMLNKATLALQDGKKETIAKVMELEAVVDEIHDSIETFLDDNRFTSLNENELRKLAYLRHSATDIERVADHANYLAELAEKKLKRELSFSEEAEEELAIMCEKTKLIYEKALIALGENNEEAVKKVKELEDEMDRLHRLYEGNHIRRLEHKLCDPLVGIIFVDVLRNLERIGDHSADVANTTLIGF